VALHLLHFEKLGIHRLYFFVQRVNVGHRRNLRRQTAAASGLQSVAGMA